MVLVTAVLICVAVLPGVVSVRNAAAAGSPGRVWQDTEVAGSRNAGLDAKVLSSSCTSASFCVAGGYFTDGSGQQAVVSTYNGSSWTDSTIAGALNVSVASVKSVSCTSVSFCVAGVDHSSDEWHLVQHQVVGGECCW